MVGFFNPDLNEKVVKEISGATLWLDPDKTYLCYDFWKEQFLGEVLKDFRVNVDPGSVTLLSFHEKKDVPQFISTTRHVMQGAVEIEDIRFDLQPMSYPVFRLPRGKFIQCDCLYP